VDRTGSGSCAVVGCDISAVEPLCSAVRTSVQAPLGLPLPGNCVCSLSLFIH